LEAHFLVPMVIEIADAQANGKNWFAKISFFPSFKISKNSKPSDAG